MDSAGCFCLTQKFSLRDLRYFCISRRSDAGATQACFKRSQELLRCFFACSFVVKEPKPDSLTAARLAYAALILDHLFSKSHNGFSCLRPRFNKGCRLVFSVLFHFILQPSDSSFLHQSTYVLLYFPHGVAETYR